MTERLIKRSIAIILNTTCQQQKSFSKTILPALEAQNQVDVLPTQRHNHAIDLTFEAIARGKYDVIYAAGGNGTVNQVVHAMAESESHRGDKMVLGIIPLGMANDFAKCLRIRKDARQLIKLLATFSTVEVNIGKLTYTHSSNNKDYRYFINVADAGMGPEVVKKVMETRRTFGPAIQYYKSIIETFFTYKPMHVSAKADGWEWEGKLRSFAVANAKYYGNGLCIAPNAVLNDDIFNVFISGDVSVVDFIKHSDTLKRGKKVEIDDVQYREAKKVDLNADATCLVQADGELLGRLPATIEVVPKKVSVLAPPAILK